MVCVSQSCFASSRDSVEVSGNHMHPVFRMMAVCAVRRGHSHLPGLLASPSQLPTRSPSLSGFEILGRMTVVDLRVSDGVSRPWTKVRARGASFVVPSEHKLTS